MSVCFVISSFCAATSCDIFNFERPKDDKSKFFKIHGYTLENADELYEQIMNGTKFNQAKFEKMTEYGIIVSIPTKIFSHRKGSAVEFKTIWICTEDRWLRLVTVDLTYGGK